MRQSESGSVTLVQQVQSIRPVVDEVNSLSGNIDESEQDSCTCRIEQYGACLSAVRLRNNHVAVVSVGGENVSVDRQSQAQWIVQTAAHRERCSSAVAGVTSERIRDCCNPIVQAVRHIQHLLVLTESYSSGADYQCSRVGTFCKAGPNHRER